jgi:hypothetical protein
MEVIEKISPSVVIEGEAKGADEMARDVANALHIPVEAYPAEWETYGRAAGPIRNQQMLDNGAPDLVVYFAVNLETSVGTRDMVRRAEKARVPVLSWETILLTDPPYDNFPV